MTTRGAWRRAIPVAAALQVALGLLLPAATVSAAHSWTIGTSTTTVVHHVVTGVGITVQNTSTNNGGGESTGCVVIRIPGEYDVTDATIDAVGGGYAWTADSTTSGGPGTTVTLAAIDDSNRLRGDPDFTTLTATITVEGMTEGTADWDVTEYEHSDCSKVQATATLSMAVTAGSNAAPVALADGWSVIARRTLTVPGPGVLANDSDPDGDPITAVIETDVAHGTLNLAADGSFSYTPSGTYTGPDSFTYRATDGTDVSAPATVSITVTNAAPTAAPEAYSTLHGILLTVGPGGGVLANDGDADGDPLTAVLETDVSHGTLVLGGDGSFTYLPDLLYVGPDSFSYRASDGIATSSPVTVSIDAQNAGPVATDDGDAVVHDRTLVADASAGVLANDTDADGDALTASLVADVTHGSLSLQSDGSFSYAPDVGYVGPDSFTYRASDGIATSSVATVSIDVTNATPTAADDAAATVHDTPIVVAQGAGVLANDGDADGDPLTALLDTDVANGTLVLGADGSWTYTPDAGFVGSDSFTYRAGDGIVTSSVATVSIDVTDSAPTAADDSATVIHDRLLARTSVSGVLANDADADGDPLTAVLVDPPAHGVLSLGADGGYTYQPDAGFVGTDTFTYRATSATAASAIATVTISVTNVVPAAADDASVIVHDRSLVVTAPGVLANDGDTDGDSLIAALASFPANGTVTLATDGSWVYAPDAGFVGTDSFTYRAFDGADVSSLATVTIDVTDADPVAQPDTATLVHDRTLVVASADGVLANDIDADGDALTAALVAGPASGTLALAPDGGFRFTPGASFVGTDSFTYRAWDGARWSAPTTVSITITNSAPVAVADSWTTRQNTVLRVPAPGVLAGDTDPDGDPLVASPVTPPGSGTLVLRADGSFNYTPGPGTPGPATFTYAISDGAASSTATVTILVTAVPPPSPSPTPTPVPTATPSPDSTAAPTSEPAPTDPAPSDAPSPSPSAEPTPSGPAPSPSASPSVVTGPTPPGGGTGAGGTDTFSVPMSGAGGTGDAPWSPDAMMALALDGFDWQIPGLLLSVPGLLVVVAIGLQLLGGAAWLPIVRRSLGTFGLTALARRRRREQEPADTA